MKKILVACASGVASSQTAASKIEKLLKERKIKAELIVGDMKSLEREIKYCDVYVTLTPYSKKDYGVPVISGIPFLTGVGIEKAFEELAGILTK